MIDKIKNIGFYDEETGEILDKDIGIGILNEDRKSKLRELFYKIDNCPNELSVEQIQTLCSIMKVDLKYLDNFSSYHIVNDFSMGNLFELNISMKAYYYFGLLTTKYCSSTYTLLFNNNKHIEKDVDISKLLNITKNAWGFIKKELEELKLIKKINFNNKTYYKVNPLYIRKGKTITESTWFAFRDEIINSKSLPDIKIIYWDKILEQDYGITNESIGMDTIYKGLNIEKQHSKH